MRAVVVAAPASGSGKTTVATGLVGALRKVGHRVAPFKVGPDYIDPGYHGLAAGRPGRNLDPVLVGVERVVPLFRHGARGCDLAVVEGVMGLFDGRIDDEYAGPVAEGSTAQVAALLGAPVVLVVDARGHSQSLAALLHGFATFDSGVRLGGVILNRVGSERHDQVLRAACDRVGLPVLGSLPRLAELEVPSRHLGLIPAVEHGSAATAAVAAMTDLVAAHVDLHAIAALARSSVTGPAWDPAAAVRGLEAEEASTAAFPAGAGGPEASRVRGELGTPESPPLGGISDSGFYGEAGDSKASRSSGGVGDSGATTSVDGGRDSRVSTDPGGESHAGEIPDDREGPLIAVAGGPAFTFGYAEHRELLVAAGAQVVVFDPLHDELPTGTAALVLPGGFPEEHAADLAANSVLLRAVADAARHGMPVHAECAGLLYLTRSLDGHPMAGVVDADAAFGPRLTLGYRDAVALADSPLWRVGERVRGHEFHRTRLVSAPPTPAWGWRGSAGETVREGTLSGNVHASYLHTHPAGNPAAVRRFVTAAMRFASSGATG
ncbi:cobyrinate a,c-diamide synthase [Nocardia gamkensis]|uniref:Hydrogenobyrinate a,c-diamide synthase n=1 Tax=Nocardia gamkensis TaxID=352869 RepID=A0A7X6L2E8_9NOCA|nr:cobyrinate a,c-diamide synthase [Nocardia gamkensis]NKY26508.1 cobyrinate a,c-diamide synthase [Nocardia gamkensis]NQE67662.1 Hydrogenobyrinate a,c-diamide synthase [Nocardia gamkensis]